MTAKSQPFRGYRCRVLADQRRIGVSELAIQRAGAGTDGDRQISDPLRIVASRRFREIDFQLAICLASLPPRQFADFLALGGLVRHPLCALARRSHALAALANKAIGEFSDLRCRHSESAVD